MFTTALARPAWLTASARLMPFDTLAAIACAAALARALAWTRIQSLATRSRMLAKGAGAAGMTVAGATSA